MARSLWCLATLAAAAPLPWCPEGSLVSLADRVRDGCADWLPPPWADPVSARAAWSALQGVLSDFGGRGRKEVSTHSEDVDRLWTPGSLRIFCRLAGFQTVRTGHVECRDAPSGVSRRLISEPLFRPQTEIVADIRPPPGPPSSLDIHPASPDEPSEVHTHPAHTPHTPRTHPAHTPHTRICHPWVLVVVALFLIEQRLLFEDSGDVRIQFRERMAVFLAQLPLDRLWKHVLYEVRYEQMV